MSKYILLNRKDLQFSNVRYGVILKHKPTGAWTISRRRGLSKLENSSRAFRRLCKNPKVRIWIQEKLFNIHQNKPLEEVKKIINAARFRVEVNLINKNKTPKFRASF